MQRSDKEVNFEEAVGSAYKGWTPYAAGGDSISEASISRARPASNEVLERIEDSIDTAATP